ncbi:hypothetical protein [Desulfotomaculum sp. 1211_IL3151]|uniref:hypothetical protein n=1 Tax=Desulfotomaculum sp. 1211_IL3151 TaxID=3084055 RepID=UPI002FDACEB7
MKLGSTGKEKISFNKYKKGRYQNQFVSTLNIFMVERTGFEPVNPTVNVVCGTK